MINLPTIHPWSIVTCHDSGSNCKAWSSPALLGTALLLDWRHKFEFEEPTSDPLIQTAPNRSFATTASKQPPTSFPGVGRGGFFWGRSKVLQKSTSDKSSNRAMKNQPLFIFSSLSLSNFLVAYTRKGFQSREAFGSAQWCFRMPSAGRDKRRDGVLSSDCGTPIKEEFTESSRSYCWWKNILHHVGCIKPYETWDLLTSFRISSINRKNTQWKMMTFPRTKGSFLLQNGSFSTVNWETKRTFWGHGNPLRRSTPMPSDPCWGHLVLGANCRFIS